MTLEDLEKGQVFLIDKEIGWTSFDVVNRMRGAIKQKHKKTIKVGHAGTLDPLATGLLIICTGRFTKKLGDFQGMDKIYTGTFSLGATTISFDLESPVIPTEGDFKIPSDEHLKSISTQFLGEISQVPPAFSAMKVGGERSYELARKGEAVKLEPRKVCIHEFEVDPAEMLESMAVIKFMIKCSKGTYIRSIARDFGNEAGTGAFLSSLRRTAIGEFQVDNAMKVDDFRSMILEQSGTENQP